jgi:RNA polymerase sigma factor FliA
VVTAVQGVSEDQVVCWWRAWRDESSLDARNALIEHYLGLARGVAASLYRLRTDNSVAFDDYQQYGRMGLMQAVERFDPGVGIPFEAYAARRVRGSILNGLGKESEVLAQRASRASQERDRLRSLREGAAEVNKLDRLIHVTLTLAIGAILDGEFTEPVDDSPTGNPYAATEFSQLSARAWRLMEQLPEKERWLMQRHYGEGVEFQHIAEELSISKGRVSQLHAQALARLRERLTESTKEIRGGRI